MMRLCSLKLILPVVGLLSLSHGVSNSEPGSQAKLMENQRVINPIINKRLAHKNYWYINQYGWFITRKWDQELKVLQLDGKDYPIIQYYVHPSLDFMIFKVDLGNDARKEQYFKLEFLGTQEDLKYMSDWVRSSAFVLDPLVNKGILSDKTIEENSKILLAISKIESQENGRLLLSRGSSMEKLCEEVWPEVKDRWKNEFLKNAEYIENILLKDPSYKEEYLKEKVIQLNQTRDQLIIQKNGLSADIEFLIEAKTGFNQILNQVPSQGVFNALHYVRIQVNNLDQKIKDLQLKQEEIARLLSSDQESLWQDRRKQLIEQQNHCINGSKLYGVSLVYGLANLIEKRSINVYVKSNFYASYLGVADKEDNGGIILIPSKELTLDNHIYKLFFKIVGITDIKENDPWVKGENSFAIDLTTPEVHQWISDTMDKYYEELNGGPSSRKRSGDDIEVVSDKRIKQEAIEEELPRRSNSSLEDPEEITIDWNEVNSEDIKEEH